MKHFVARDRLLTTKKAAEVTGLDPETIKYAARSGRLPYTTLNGSTRPIRRYKLSDLQKLTTEHRPEDRERSV